jgi:hypothetical protein
VLRDADRSPMMLDILLLGTGAALFALAAAYGSLCERL